MTCFDWVMLQTENLFDFSWLCGNVNHVSSETTSVKMNKAKFVQGVSWSGIEWEDSILEAEDSFDRSFESRGDTEDDEWTDEGETTDDDDEERSAQESIKSCQEPQEKGSNIPVLRQLPSFGSTLRSSSMQSDIHNDVNSGLSSYRTRSRSTESVTQQKRYSLKQHVADEESPVQVKTQFHTSAAAENTVQPGSFIFMRV